MTTLRPPAAVSDNASTASVTSVGRTPLPAARANHATQHADGDVSGGQRQRVSLMRALMLQPKVLLLDEPLGALDPMVRARLQDELKENFSRLQQTIVLVTHDMAEAGFFANLIVLLNEGRVSSNPERSTTCVTRPASTFVRDFLHAQRGLAAI